MQIQKESEVVNMCQAIEDMKKDSRMEAQQQERKNLAEKLLKNNICAIDKIAMLTGLSLSEVTALQQNM